MLRRRPQPQPPPDVSSTTNRTCGNSHRSSLLLQTPSGGAICLVCFSNLLSTPSSPSHHVSYAVSQISLALASPDFRLHLLARHAHVLVAPLVQALGCGRDEGICGQIVDLVEDLVGGSGGVELARDFVGRIGDVVASGALAWSRVQIYMLHCLGILLDRCHATGDSSICIRDVPALVSNLIVGLELPSEEIRGEIMYVLFKLSLLQDMSWHANDDTGDNELSTKLLRAALDALLQTQSDEVRLNCIALLTVFARTGHFENSFTNNLPEDISTEEDILKPLQCIPPVQLVNLFADSVKGPLLSSDEQVQIGILDLIFHLLSSKRDNNGWIQVLVEESVPDYVFEILRLSDNKDSLVVSSLRVLDLLATAEDFFKQRLMIGFPVLLSILHYIAEIPLHPVQPHALKLVERTIFNCPGAISISQLEELAMILTEIFRRHTSGEMGMIPETFTLVCSTFVEVLKSPSAVQLPKVAALIQEASRYAVLSALPAHGTDVSLHSLYFLKEAYWYCCGLSPNMKNHSDELANSIIEICEIHILPWLRSIINEGGEEDIVLGMLETFHYVLVQGPEINSRKFAGMLASSSWFGLSFGLLGLFSSERIKLRIYLMLSSVIDGVIGHDVGQPIRDSYLYLPSDPLDLLYLLGQRTTVDVNLVPAQSAVITIMYTSALYDVRLADESQVLASLEQYILMNNSNFASGIAGSMILTELVHLYAFIRGAQETSRMLHSSDAEKILFHLITENDWDLLCISIHPIALKWLFKQDSIFLPLSHQLLAFCRFYGKAGNQLSCQENKIRILDIRLLADMVVSRESGMTSHLVSLLKHCQQEGGEEDVIFVMNAIQAILNIVPEGSSEFCLQGIDNVISDLYRSHSTGELFTSCSAFVFNILQSVSSDRLCCSKGWMLVTFKLLECLAFKLADAKCSKEACQIIGVFSLMLYHSTNQALREASTAIMLNTSLVSTIETIIQAYCAKGPALMDQNEETDNELLLFVLLLYFFTLKSLHALLEDSLDWHEFLQSSNESQPSSVICIRCHDLCRLMHYGSSLVKLIASKCLLELLSRITNYKTKMDCELRCSRRHLRSMIAVTEGLTFYEDSTVATNCGLCLSMMLRWEEMNPNGKAATNVSRWCRLIMEELTLCLAMPGLASKSISNQHKPATHVAIALLRLIDKSPWMRSLFDPSCISGIVNKLSASNVSAEMVELFRELHSREYLNKEQIEALQNVFQACWKHAYVENCREDAANKVSEILIVCPNETGKMCKVLMNRMMNTSMLCNRTETKRRRLLEEIELFFQHL